MGSSPSLRGFLKRLACGRVATVPRAAAYCVRCARRGDFFRDVLSTAIAEWIDKDFVLNADDERREFVTLVVVYGLKFIEDDEAFAMAVVPGVSTHLESTRQIDRYHAMIVAEAFAKVVKQDLAFDELTDQYRAHVQSYLRDLDDEFAKDDEENVIVTTTTKEAWAAADARARAKDEETIEKFSGWEKREHAVAEKKQRRQTKDAIKRDQTRRERPDDVILSGSESESDDEEVPLELSDDEESLEAFDLTDPGDDLAAVQKPRYLRDLITLLETKREKEDSRECHSVAIESAEVLIRSRPADLKDAAVTLATCLLHLSNTFDLPNFQDRCRSSLIALTALRPTEVTAYLIPSAHRHWIPSDVVSGIQQ